MKNATFQKLFSGAVFALFIMSLATAGIAGEYVSVKKDGVNIRSGPNTKSKVIWQVFENFPLEVLKREGKWAHVIDFEGDKGWIYETLIRSNKKVIVTVETANLRAGSNKNEPIVATVKKGVVFEPLEMDGDWMRIRYKNEITGWMHKSLLWPSDPF
ncbi:MAG: SH3 domain-containing protein [Desulfobulbales bacterium]|nr:SH3 domain-containing protein [Desulfobulbales bacterium]